MCDMPPPKAVGVDLINSNLNNFLSYQRIPADSIQNIPYRPQFKLDYLASSGVGVGVGIGAGSYGAGLSSGIQGVFSDILGRNQIYAGASVNGEIYDFAGQVFYIQQKGRWNFGGGISHIPYQLATYNVVPTTYDTGNQKVSAIEERYDIIRIFQDQLSAFTSYPFSKVTRAEFGGGISRNSYMVTRYSTYYDSVGRYIDFQRNRISNDKYNNDPYNNVGTLRPITLMQVSAALIGDNSFFGIASPLSGFRYRLQAEYDFGSYRFFSPTIDIRKYARLKPVTLAARFNAFGRFGQDTGLYPYYIGYPFLIRGYESQTFYGSNTSGPTNGFTISQLSGSRVAVANFEIRLPFTGPEKLSAIKSKFLFTELNLFFDAGLAWNRGNQIKFQKSPDFIGLQQQVDNTGKPVLDKNGAAVLIPTYNNNQRVPALSAGISVRVNLFGALILEPYYAIPFNRTDVKKPVFGLNFTPGW